MWIKSLHSSPYYPNMVQLNKYDHVTPFLHAALRPRDYDTRTFVFKNKVFSFRTSVRKVTHIKQMFQSRMIHGQDDVKEE